MTVASGSICYSLGAAPVTGTGLTWAAPELDAAVKGPVSALVFDDTGKADIAALLAGVADTAFEKAELARVLAPPSSVEDWRVGEAVAETYLSEHKNCSFPWPDGRDERKSGSSLPGADLVGFHKNNEGERFAFGEVKTSAESKYPPQTMYGRTGLKKQLEDLRDDKSVRDGLVTYLGFRARKASWIASYRAASKRYLNNHRDVQLFGVLVRDVSPHHDDLRARVDKLSGGCPAGTVIELMAIYLPAGSIGGLASSTLATKSGGAA